jgi:hypothetical protein
MGGGGIGCQSPSRTLPPRAILERKPVNIIPIITKITKLVNMLRYAAKRPLFD